MSSSRLTVLVNKKNLPKIIDIFVNNGHSGSFCQVVLYHYLAIRSFDFLIELDVLLKYRRGYNIGFTSIKKKKYFSDINRILLSHSETGIRWAQRMKPTEEFNMSYAAKDCLQFDYKCSEIEGYEIGPPLNDGHIMTVNKKMSIKSKLMDGNLKDEEALKSKSKKGILERIGMALEKKAVEESKQAKKYLLKIKSTDKFVKKEIDEASKFNCSRISIDEILDSKDIKYISLVKKERSEAIEKIERIHKLIPLENFKGRSDLVLLDDIPIVNTENLKKIRPIIKGMINSYDPPEEVIEIMGEINKNMGGFFKYGICKMNNDPKIVEYAGYLKNIKKLIGRLKVVCKETGYKESRVMRCEVKEIYIDSRLRWVESLKKEREETEIKYERQVKESQEKKMKGISELSEMKETKRFEEIDKIISRVKKSDITDLTHVIEIVEGEVRRERELIDKKPWYEGEPWSSYGYLKSSLATFQSLMDNKEGWADRLRILHSDIEDILDCREKISSKGEKVVKEISKLYINEFKRWKRLKYNHELSTKPGCNPTFGILEFDKMKIREKAISEMSGIVKLDDLGMSESEMEFTRDVIKELREKERKSVEALLTLKNMYEKPDFKDKRGIEILSNKYNINKGWPENLWLRSYDEKIKDEMSIVLDSYLKAIDKFKSLVGVSPYGWIIGSQRHPESPGYDRYNFRLGIEKESVDEILNFACVNEIRNEENQNSYKKILLKETRQVKGNIPDYNSTYKCLESINRKIDKGRKNEIARSQMSFRTNNEAIYDLLINNKPKEDSLANMSVLEEIKAKRRSSIVRNEGVKIEFGKKMEKEVKVKNSMHKKKAYEMFKDITLKCGVEMKNRFLPLLDEEIVEGISSVIDSIIESGTEIMENTHDHVRKYEYNERKRVMVQSKLKEGVTPKKLLEEKNKFSIENNSLANKNYSVTSMVSYIKIISVLYINRVSSNSKIYKEFGLKKCQSKYMLSRIKPLLKKELEKMTPTKVVRKDKRKGKSKEGSSSSSGTGDIKQEVNVNKKELKVKPFIKRGFL